MKLRELIRAVRAAKTAAEERAVITKEAALIRSAFKSDTSSTSMMRHRNVAKLLYIHMLGYPSHFGQMETLKLISSPVFAEKRMGYLALGILLDENQEILMLVTNCMKNDLRHPNQYVCGLALTALGNISSTEMTRDLASEIDTHMRHTNPYVRKKAALCAHRIMVKVPDLIEDFIDRTTALLNDRNHGVLYTGIQLILYIMTEMPDYRAHFQRTSIVKKLVKRLNSLVRSGFQPDYDVSGCTDPFLQVSFIRLMRLIGHGNKQLSEMMSDVLAQVATNTETSKSVGHAILYECVLTIMHIEAESGLRVLAINLLGRFLSNTDNNTRFVGLKTLSMVINRDKSAVGRHKNTIIDCLKDPDISIRKRAMELIFELVDSENVRTLAREMLNYLVTSKDENRSQLCLRISAVVSKFAPSPHWHLETLITMMSIGGESITQDIVSRVIRIITRESSLQRYVTHKLYRMLCEDLSQIPLTNVGIWTIGEYGQHLLEGCQDNGTTFDPVEDATIVSLLSKCMKIYFSTETMKGMTLTALTKLMPKFPNMRAKMEKMIHTFKQSLRTDLQQRSIEYSELLTSKWDSIRPQIQLPVPPMPLAEVKSSSNDDATTNDANTHDSPSSSNNNDILDILGAGSGNMASVTTTNANGGGTDDLLAGLFDNTSSPAPALPTATSNTKEGGDMLSDIFGGSSAPAPSSTPNGLDDIFGNLGTSNPAPAPAPSPVPVPAPVPAPVQQSVMDLMDFGSPSPAPIAIPSVVAFDDEGVKTVFTFSKPNGPNTPETVVQLTTTNSNSEPITGFELAGATPKYIKIAWQPASGSTLPPGGQQGNISQQMTLTNSQQSVKRLMIRLKISFSVGGRHVTKMTQVDNIPSEL
jgi:AP-1 complex subunit gamma-1